MGELEAVVAAFATQSEKGSRSDVERLLGGAMADRCKESLG